MSKNRLTIASVVLVGLIVLTVVMVNARQADYAPTTTTEVKLPKIEEDKVDELELGSAEHGTTKLVKKGDEWRVTEPVDARADQDAVKAAIKKLTELKVTGLAATKKENHGPLEVSEDKAVHVVARSGGKTLLDAYIGRYDSGNTMFRLKDQAPVATVEGSVKYVFSKATKDLRDKVITKMEPADIQKITFDGKNGHFEFERSGDDWKQILGKGQKPIKPLDIPKVRGIVGSASGLNASDFAAPGVTAEQAGLGAGASTVTLKVIGPDDKVDVLEDVVFRVGAQKDSYYYLQRQGVDTIYLVSAWLGGRFQPKADDLTKKDPPKTPEPTAAAPSAPGGGQQQLDPKLMQEIQRQIQQQQQMQQGSPH
jgi:hypothetical protein